MLDFKLSGSACQAGGLLKLLSVDPRAEVEGERKLGARNVLPS